MCECLSSVSIFALYRSAVSTLSHSSLSLFFFFNDTATTEIYTLSLHDALPISPHGGGGRGGPGLAGDARGSALPRASRSEEHTSELQSRQYLVCRLLLEKKKKKKKNKKKNKIIHNIQTYNKEINHLSYKKIITL